MPVTDIAHFLKLGKENLLLSKLTFKQVVNLLIRNKSLISKKSLINPN